MTEEHTAEKLNEFIDFIEKEEGRLNSTFPNFGVINSCYRGQSDKDYKLIPSIDRNRSAVGASLLCREAAVIDEIKNKKPDVFSQDLQPIDLLALLQHHGMKTRLLDVTDNPLVALFFACYYDSAKDGEVIIFKRDLSEMLDSSFANGFADTCRFAWGSETLLTDFYENIVSQPYFHEKRLEHERFIKDSKIGARLIYEACKDKILFVNASTRSTRQFVQQGSYILFPNSFGDDSENKTDAELCFA